MTVGVPFEGRSIHVCDSMHHCTCYEPVEPHDIHAISIQVPGEINSARRLSLEPLTALSGAGTAPNTVSIDANYTELIYDIYVYGFTCM